MNQAFLLIGGNIGDRVEHLSRANDLIQQSAGKVVQKSLIYETAAWGRKDQPSFLNQVLLIEPCCSPFALLEKLLSIEEQLGRKRREKFGPRTIDIDILFYNNDIINEPDLIIPHPALQDRRFVLIPLVEIAAGLIHPVFNKTMKELLRECKDELAVEEFNV